MRWIHAPASATRSRGRGFYNHCHIIQRFRWSIRGNGEIELTGDKIVNLFIVFYKNI